MNHVVILVVLCLSTNACKTAEVEHEQPDSALLSKRSNAATSAPQWTIPTLLTGHLYWKLTQVPLDVLKKNDESPTADQHDEDNDEETATLIQSNREPPISDSPDQHPIDENNGNDDASVTFDDDPNDHDDVSIASSAFSFITDPDATLIQKVVKYFTTTFLYVLFGSWSALTIGCFWTMDWTLVVGHVMTLWLCVGSTQFPRHPLWSLYHMVSCTVLLIINTMTMVGWYMCHVAITTHALHALPPKAVAFSIIVQTVLHFVALLHTTCTKHWRVSYSVPGLYLWDHVRIVGDELHMWYYVFS